MLTRNGVCRDLEFSPYQYTVCHKGQNTTYNFSSKLHLKNFTEKRKENYVMIYNYIYKRFKFKTDCVLLADFNLYKKIENRGCYINHAGDIITNLDEVNLNN